MTNKSCPCDEEHPELDWIRRGGIIGDIEGTLLLARQQAARCEQLRKRKKRR